MSEDKLIFSSVDETTPASCVVYATWFLVANYIFIFYDALEDIYGVSDEEDRPVFEVWKDKGEDGEQEQQQQRGDRRDSDNALDIPLL